MPSEVGGTTSNFLGPPRHCNCRRGEWYHRCQASRTIPCHQSLLFRLLAELLQRSQSRHLVYVLVRRPDIHRFGVRLSGAFLTLFVPYNVDVNFTQMIKAIWPSVAQFPNHLPPSAKITSMGVARFCVEFARSLTFFSQN